MNVYDISAKDMKPVELDVSEGLVLKRARALLDEFAENNIKLIYCVTRFPHELLPNSGGRRIHSKSVFNVDKKNPGARNVAWLLLSGKWRMMDDEEIAQYMHEVHEAQVLAARKKAAKATSVAQASIRAMMGNVSGTEQFEGQPNPNAELAKMQQTITKLKTELEAAQAIQKSSAPVKQIKTKKNRNPESVIF